MMTTRLTAIASNRHLLAEELAANLALRPQSIRKPNGQPGAYSNVRPVDAADGRLVRAADSVVQLLTREA
jgi:hypothetical protein